MNKKLLIGVAICVAVLTAGSAGWSLNLRDKAVDPRSFAYGFKLAGEWLDVNFLVFGAPEKQARHLELSQKRLDEYLSYRTKSLDRKGGNDGSYSDVKIFDKLRRGYEMELARAEFMAEQLALLDHKFISSIEAVYKTTFAQLGELASIADTGDFASPARLYNERAIKRLLQKHQHNAENTESYRKLVEMRLEWAKSSKNLSAPQKEILAKAAKLLEGREIEWAYDLIKQVR